MARTKGAKARVRKDASSGKNFSPIEMIHTSGNMKIEFKQICTRCKTYIKVAHQHPSTKFKCNLCLSDLKQKYRNIEKVELTKEQLKARKERLNQIQSNDSVKMYNANAYTDIIANDISEFM